jgi:hypothetical protein
MGKRWLILLGCLALVAARRVWPDFQIDALTVWLVVIAAVLFVLPEVRSAMPYIKSVKVGEAEVQLRAQVAELGQQMDEAQATIAEKHPSGLSKHQVPDIGRLLQETCRDPRAALLLLSAQMEAFVERRLQEAGLPEGSRYTQLPHAVEAGVKAGLFPPELLLVCQHFWHIRSQVVHQGAFQADPGTTLALVSLGMELFKALTNETPFGVSADDTHATSRSTM